MLNLNSKMEKNSVEYHSSFCPVASARIQSYCMLSIAICCPNNRIANTAPMSVKNCMFYGLVMTGICSQDGRTVDMTRVLLLCRIYQWGKAGSLLADRHA